MRPQDIGPVLAAAATLAIVAMTCSCASQGTASTAQESISPGSSPQLHIPPGAVPWADLSIEPYLPTPPPVATSSPAPRCSLQDLEEQPLGTGGATGNEAVVFKFSNRTARACLTGGYPSVVLSQSGQANIRPIPGGFWDQHTPPSDLAPGATAQFALGFSYECEGDKQPPLYEHVTVTLPGGGTFSQILSGAKPPNSQIPLGVFGECGVSVTELAPFTAPQPAYPTDPFAILAASIQAPSTVPAGTTIIYVVTLSNPSSAPIAMAACRGYYQTLDSAKSPYFAYELNCGAARPIPADGSEGFVMEMPTSATPPGWHTLCWTLDKGANSGAATCTRVDLLG